MEKEVEVSLDYPIELKEFLLEKIAKSPFKLQTNAFQDVLDWIKERKIVDVVTIEIEPEYDEARGD